MRCSVVPIWDWLRDAVPNTIHQPHKQCARPLLIRDRMHMGESAQAQGAACQLAHAAAHGCRPTPLTQPYKHHGPSAAIATQSIPLWLGGGLGWGCTHARC
jgi:hypothetical protein